MALCMPSVCSYPVLSMPLDILPQKHNYSLSRPTPWLVSWYPSPSRLMYILIIFQTCLVGLAADRTGRRGIFNIVFALIGCVGFSMLVATRNPHVAYAGTYL